MVWRWFMNLRRLTHKKEFTERKRKIGQQRPRRNLPLCWKTKICISRQVDLDGILITKPHFSISICNIWYEKGNQWHQIYREKMTGFIKQSIQHGSQVPLIISDFILFLIICGIFSAFEEQWEVSCTLLSVSQYLLLANQPRSLGWSEERW